MSDFELLKYLLPKIIAATFCGVIIGLEREVKNKSAGIRTHVLICVGACLFTSIGIILAGKNTTESIRIIGQIITGIGFLGGGVIFKQEDKIVGVTSAAFIWFMSSIGVIVGMGYILTSIVLTIGLLLVSLQLQKFEHKLK